MTGLIVTLLLEISLIFAEDLTNNILENVLCSTKK